MNAPRSARLRRNAVWAFRVLAAVAGIWSLLFTWRIHAAARELDAALADHRERGAPTSLQELMDEPQPSSSSAAGLVRAILQSGGNSASALVPFADPVLTRNVELAVGRIPPVERSRLLDGAWAALDECRPGHPEFDRALAALPKIMPHLENAVSRPPGRLVRVVDENSPWSTSHLPEDVLHLAQLLNVEVLDAIGRQDSSRAFRAVRVLARLERCLSRELCLADQRHRWRLARDSAHMLAVTMSGFAPTEAEFAFLDAAFAGWKTESFIAGVRGERCIALAMLEPRCLNELLAFKVVDGDLVAERTWKSGFRAAVLKSWLGRADLLREKLFLVRYFDRWESWIRQAAEGKPDPVVAPQPIEPSLAGVVLQHHFLSRDPGSLVQEIREHRNLAWFCRLALRVARYRDQNGAYPNDLKLIEDADVSAGPSPWLDGKAPHYRRNEGGFSIEDPTEAADGNGVRLVVKRSTPKR